MSSRILGPTEITADAVKSLIGTAEEGQTIDFKRAINLEKAEAKRDLAVDISAFANESGGDIVFGMDQTSDGVASRLVSLPQFNRDHVELQIRQVNQAHIEPAVTGLEFVSVEFETGQFAAVLRIPRSWNRPHSVVGKPYTWHILGEGNGNRSMKPRELRETFTLAAEISERMKNFRVHRVDHLIKGAPPVFLSSRELIIIHVLPVSAFDTPSMLDLVRILHDDLGLAHPLHADVSLGTRDARYNFDGIIAHRRLVREGEQTQYYTQIFRNGCIESVNSRILEARPAGTTAGILTGYEFGTKKRYEDLCSFLRRILLSRQSLSCSQWSGLEDGRLDGKFPPVSTLKLHQAKLIATHCCCQKFESMPLQPIIMRP